MPANPRAEVMKMLNGAVSEATAGEIHRAVDFLKAARKVRLGKRQLRQGWRGKTHSAR